MPNLANARQMLVAALWAGLWAGLFLTAIQRLQVLPLIQQAELYEVQATAIPSHTPAEHAVPHQAEETAWQPQEGWERTAYTAVANISLAVGFALLLAAAGNLRGGLSGWRKGLAWGLAGYVAFFVAPSLGLPPELPGTQAALLKDRQFWWVLTVADTALGLWLLAFAKTSTNKLFGLVLLVSPHLLGAPQPEFHDSAAPAELARRFIIATTIANALFWLVLGGLIGRFFAPHTDNKPV
ncbi:CbtA family protein [Methylovulum psychrotolerans]|uniref:Cobalt transporter n=1 Tax=Methylovulum psychrotolerans TaxID=1704499 RepID=A0A1Z4BZ91_9GAMM|nr:CbtA family protein [Methylovulum psychrotolerans]ASF46614.1 hypothetical protein CEK71_11330 [Methylovulum psychrotolerans]